MNAHSKRASAICLLASVIGLWAAAGCSVLPEAQADPTKFYVLSASSSAAAPAAEGAPVVLLRDVELASYLRARPMIVRRSEHEIEFRDYARWGEPLELGIARVLREELLARGAVSAVRTSTLRPAPVPHDRELHVRVLACEGGADGAVLFRARWEFTGTDAAATPARGEFRAEGVRWDGESEASLAAGLSQAVAGLANEISAALKK